MKLLGARQLSVLLVGTLLFCHGIFGGRGRSHHDQ